MNDQNEPCAYNWEPPELKPPVVRVEKTIWLDGRPLTIHEALQLQAALYRAANEAMA